MAKNIVLCSDGTGNKGGTGAESNVFKIYNAVKINRDQNKNEKEQIVFYDNGVGTSKHAVYRAIGGAFGWGFKENVRDLYEFLGRNYDYKEQDDIYIFGFSRGAATVRAFVGMIETCGLVVKNLKDMGGDELDEEEYQAQIDLAMKEYMSKKTHPKEPNRKRDVKIEFMGIWDTVSSLGMPQLGWVDDVLNIFLRHKFYNYEPQSVINHLYHAIAIDDERRTFWPMVWNEKKFKGKYIEQVWFPGVHSNVGGGYPRSELSTVTLDWMIERLKGHRECFHDPDHGLHLKEDHAQEAKENANPFGKIYDSRAGFALLYRYQPRPIDDLCKDKLKDNVVKIHNSAIGRMKKRTAGYSPGQVPTSFDIVKTRDPDDTSSTKHLRKSYVGNRIELDKVAGDSPRSKVDEFKNKRISLYWVFLASTLIALLISGNFWMHPPTMNPDSIEWRKLSFLNWSLGHLADFLRYVLPDFFEGAITKFVIQHPVGFLCFVVYIALLYFIRFGLQDKMDDAKEKFRIKILGKIEGVKKQD